jgi:hypothetical protein
MERFDFGLVSLLKPLVKVYWFITNYIGAEVKVIFIAFLALMVMSMKVYGPSNAREGFV